MSTNYEIQYFPTYKTFDGFKYHLNYPDEWILCELPDTGRQCTNCVGDGNNGYAMWRGIILGYCANCARDYNHLRGRGFMCHGVESDCRGPSAFDLYLGEINWDNYGDVSVNPEDTMENRAEFLEHCFEVDSEPEIDEPIHTYSDDSEDEQDEYYDEDDFGECLHIGCGKPSKIWSAYCLKHVREYDP